MTNTAASAHRYLNRRWVLAQRPEADISTEGSAATFRRDDREESLQLEAGQVLLRNRVVSFEPAMRGWLDDVPSYLPPVGIDEVMRSATVAEVIASRSEAFKVGQLASGLGGWQDYCVIDDKNSQWRALPEGTPDTMPLSILGATSMTAYFGLLDIGRPKAGDTVLVSGAAGATGSVVCQIAKIKGCRVIALAGSADKCQWLEQDCGVDIAINYREQALNTALEQHCPDGINVFFDNVGGDTLEAGIAHMADHGSIVLCGAISRYNGGRGEPGPSNLELAIARRLRLQGFILFDHLSEMDRCMNDLLGWLGEGKLKWREDVQTGFEQMPQTLKRLFSGENQGKQLLRIDARQ